MVHTHNYTHTHTRIPTTLRSTHSTADHSHDEPATIPSVQAHGASSDAYWCELKRKPKRLASGGAVRFLPSTDSSPS